jgi:CysZ protein
MIRAFARAFGQLNEPELRRYVGISIAATLAAFLLLWGVAIAALTYTTLPSFDLFGWTFDLDFVADIAGAIAVFLLLGLMFPALLIVIVSFFLDGVADAVEGRHYPGLGPARDQGIAEIVAITAKFAALTIVLNLLALPVFLLLIFLPPFNFFVFYALNGYLLGREYYELVAHRRMDPQGALRLRRAFGGQLFVTGVVIAMLTSVPGLNLIVPIVATAAMVHLVHKWRTNALRGRSQ